MMVETKVVNGVVVDKRFWVAHNVWFVVGILLMFVYSFFWKVLGRNLFWSLTLIIGVYLFGYLWLLLKALFVKFSFSRGFYKDVPDYVGGGLL